MTSNYITPILRWKFKCLRVLFMSEGTMEQEIGQRIGAASQKAKRSIYHSIFVLSLTYGCERWVMTERMRSQIQPTEMGFLRRVAGVSFRCKVRSSVFCEELGVEPLLPCTEWSQLRWFGHLVRMPPVCLPKEVFQTCSAGKRPQSRPRSRWRDYISALAWEHLRIPSSELVDVAR